MDLSRRGFIKLSAGAAAAGGTLAAAGDASALSPAAAHLDGPRLLAQTGTPAPLGFNPADASLKYELVIANGDVLDPVQKTRAKRDIGIRFGQIAAIAPSIPADRAVQRIDAAGDDVVLCEHLLHRASLFACQLSVDIGNEQFVAEFGHDGPLLGPSG